MNKRVVLMGLIVVLALGLRVWRLDWGDITPDENHYIHDAERWWQQDPFISVRHHAFEHGRPNMGHPFLGQVLIGATFMLLGNSIFTARLVSVAAGMLTLGLILMFDRKLAWKTRATAGAIYAVMPLVVRFNRMAYLDSLLGLWILAMAWAIWHRRLILAGIMAGLAVATKLSGVFALGGGVVLLWGQGKLWQKSIKFLGAGLLTSWLLNDPSSYLNGIVNPADSEFRVLDIDYWLGGLQLFIKQALQVSWFLLGPAVSVGIVVTVMKWGGWWRRWILVSLPFLWLQPKSEYAWLPIVPPVVLALAQVINRTWIVVMLIGLTLPFTWWYGLKFRKLPYIRAGHTYNRTINDNTYKSVIEAVNRFTPANGKVMFLPQHDYPLFALRTDISWSYYGDADSFDVYVVDEKAKVPAGAELVDSWRGVEDEQTLVRLIYMR